MAQTHTLDRHKGELDRAPRDFKSNSTQIALNRNSQDFSERTYFKKSILFPKWWGLSWVGVTYGNRLGKLLTARKDRLSMYRLFASIVFYENKTKLWAHDVIGYSCLHVFHKRCQRQMRFFLSCYPLCTGEFIPNPRNASVTENFSSSLLDNCDIAIEIRSVMATCVECVSKIVISKSGNVHKQ